MVQRCRTVSFSHPTATNRSLAAQSWSVFQSMTLSDFVLYGVKLSFKYLMSFMVGNSVCVTLTVPFLTYLFVEILRFSGFWSALGTEQAFCKEPAVVAPSVQITAYIETKLCLNVMYVN